MIVTSKIELILSPLQSTKWTLEIPSSFPVLDSLMYSEVTKFILLFGIINSCAQKDTSAQDSTVHQEGLKNFRLVMAQFEISLGEGLWVGAGGFRAEGDVLV